MAAVRDICRGGSYLSPRMLSQLVDDFRCRIKSANRLPRFATLTTREREVLKMLAEGNSVKEIACDLNLSVKTVEAHKFNLMRKLDIHNKAQLVQYAIQKKIIKIPQSGVTANPPISPLGLPQGRPFLFPTRFISTFGSLQKFGRDFGYGPVSAVHLVIQFLHFAIGEFTGKLRAGPLAGPGCIQPVLARGDT